MSSSRALCCLALAKKQKKITSIFSIQCIIKQLLDSVFVIFRIIEVSVRVISLSLRLRLITPTSTSIILDVTKSSSNNCLILSTCSTSFASCINSLIPPAPLPPPPPKVQCCVGAVVCAVYEIGKSTLFSGERGECYQNAQKSNLTAICLNTRSP